MKDLPGHERTLSVPANRESARVAVRKYGPVGDKITYSIAESDAVTPKPEKMR